MDIKNAEASFIDYFKKSYGVFEIKEFASLNIETTLKYYPKGSFLIEQGKPANQLFYLVSGLTRYVSISYEGKEFTQSFREAPIIAGSTKAMVQRTPALFSIEVLEDVICLEFDWQDFFSRMKDVPGFLQTYAHMLEMLFIGKEERENAFVQKSAEERYLDFIHNNPNLSSRLPLQYIASYIGITPVALSRVRKKLANS
ncbi:Crp/Fnr family transcriptional regulator [Litoribacillus peritrichatus]|uniref:Crp/Fnr family transcriptional regulator n=1 Tax=Litoribacillus peritrichatus TaxID=718191 RepID=A0ABP7MHY6_9GAMM